MTDWKLPWKAECRCAQVRLRVTAAPLLTMACHCRGCQRMSASAYSLSAAIPAHGFEVVSGEPVIGGLHGPNRHFYCPNCKTWLFTRPAGMDEFVNLRATLLEPCAWFAPFAETSRAEGFPWASTGARHSFAEMPPPEAIPALIAEFAESGIHP